MKNNKNLRSYAIFLVGVLILFSAIEFRAQSELNDLPTAISWREFKLNSTSSDEVIKSLGKPKKDQTKISEQSLPDGWTSSAKGKRIRNISYKKIGNYDSVEFTFVEERLVGINFLVKQNRMKGLANRKSDLFEAKKLGEVLNTDFILFNGLPKNSKISDYEGQKETTVPKVYKQLYTLLGINKNSIILASIDNTNFKSGIKELFNKPTNELFPGYVQRIRIYSRKTE